MEKHGLMCSCEFKNTTTIIKNISKVEESRLTFIYYKKVDQILDDIIKLIGKCQSYRANTNEVEDTTVTDGVLHEYLQLVFLSYVKSNTNCRCRHHTEC